MAQHWSTVCALILALSAIVHYDIASASKKSHDFPGVPSSKPGVCPLRILRYGMCVNICAHDFDCGEDQKCCRNSCGGQECKAPIPDFLQKPGRCPKITGPTTCGLLCSNDGDCSGPQKCCRTCGSACMNPQ